MPKTDKQSGTHHESQSDDQTIKCVNQLMEAEKRAKEKLEQARKKKAQRVKEAREEAQHEVEVYRKASEETFKKSTNTNVSSYEAIVAKFNRMTKDVSEEMTQAFARNKGAALQILINQVLSVTPLVHENFVPKNETTMTAFTKH